MSVAGNDWFLEALLNFVDRGDFSAPLTLLVHGAILSGTPISQADYLRAFGGAMTEAAMRGGAKLPESWQEAFDQLADTAAEAEQRPQADGGGAGRPAGRKAYPYVYLKDVVLVVGNDLVAHPLWRVRLDHVSGWAVGRVGATTG